MIGSLALSHGKSRVYCFAALSGTSTQAAGRYAYVVRGQSGMLSTIDKARVADLALGKLAPQDAKELLERIELTPELSDRLELVCTLVRHPAIFESQREDSSDPSTRIGEGRAFRTRETSYVYLVRTAACILLVLGAMWGWGSLSEPPLLALGRVTLEDFPDPIRSAGHDELGIAETLIREQRYAEASDLLHWVTTVAPDREAAARAHLLEGAVLIMGAETRRLGFLVQIDSSRVMRGLGSLSKALEVSNDQELRTTSLWLTAKAHLLIGHRVQAYRALRNDELLMSRRGQMAVKYLNLLQSQEVDL